MKKVLTLALALFMLLMFAGCSGGGSTTESTSPTSDTTASAGGETSQGTDKKYTIGFSTKTITNNEFQRVMAEAAQKAVEDAGHEFVLTLSGGELEVSAQVNNIEDLINKGVDGIIVIPMDGQAVIPAIKKANEANIPVVIGDAAVAEGNEDLYVTYIGTDNYAVGQEAAKQMIDAVGEGNVLLVRGASGSLSGEARATGFKDGLEGSKLVLAGEQNGDWQSDVAMQVTENMLTSVPDAKGLFLCSDGMLPGVLSAIDNAGKTGQITVISVDGNKTAVDEIKAGNCYGTVGQFPGKIGQLCVENVLGVLDGTIDPDSVEKFIDSGYIFMSKDNLEESYEYAF